MTPDDWCVWDTGYRTECGDPAPEVRDGFRYCPRHAQAYDALTAMDARLESLEETTG